MRRLIDADTAFGVLADYYHHSMPIQYMALKEALDRVPTVEAVPIGCEGCVYDVDDQTPDPCYECKRSYPDNYKERTDETD